MVLLFASALIGQQTLEQRIASRITLDNGYGDYVRAAEIVEDGNFGAYQLWLGYKFRRHTLENEADQPLIPPGVDASDPYLEVERKMVDRYGACNRLIQAGNLKQVYDPRTTYSASTKFPELAPFKALARLEAAAAQVDFAEGRSNSAVSTLIGEITFSRKLCAGPVLSRFVGIACQTIGLSVINEHLPQLSLYDAKSLEKVSSDSAGDSTLTRDAIRRDNQIALAEVAKLFEHPSGYLAASGTNDDDGRISSACQAVAKLSRNDRDDVHSLVMGAIQNFDDGICAELVGPESGWSFDAPEQTDNDLSTKRGLANEIVDLVTMRGSEGQLLRLEGKIRTQMHLLYLHSKAIQFRWLHGHLPDKIEDFTAASERSDPFSKQSYRYERTADWYKLTSAGFGGFGEIALKYVASGGSGGAGTASPAVGNGQP
ncbi:MAG TPA: hypothetical protein VG944_08865 [Fimbriimonas sp.]|nr:hypothetical protein [Fimbriimonas sp.]